MAWKIFLAWIFFWNFGSKKFCVRQKFVPEKNLGPKKFGSKKIWVWKNFGSKKILGPKNIWVPKKFRYCRYFAEQEGRLAHAIPTIVPIQVGGPDQKMFGLKNFGSKKFFFPKKNFWCKNFKVRKNIRSKKNLVVKKFCVQKNIMSTKFGGPKKLPFLQILVGWFLLFLWHGSFGSQTP